MSKDNLILYKMGKRREKQPYFKVEIVTASRNRPVIIIQRFFKCNRLMNDNIIERLHNARRLIKNHITDANEDYTSTSPKKGDKGYNERVAIYFEKQMEKGKNEHLIFSIADEHDTTTETTIPIGHIHPNVRYKINIKPLVPEIIKILRKGTKHEEINWDKSNTI